MRRAAASRVSAATRAPRAGCSPAGARGQSLVEFSLVIPVFLVILMGLLELGFAFDHELSINYATREGSRAGAALADGSKLGVGNCGTVDQYVVSAVERVLTSEGSPLRTKLGEISSIRIFKANSSGGEAGPVNVWVPAIDVVGAGTGPSVDGRRLHFSQSSSGWDPCARSNAITNPDSVGVSLTYTYEFTTPLASVLRVIGGSSSGTLTMSDHSVMALNPTD